MKNIKRILAFLLCVVLVISLVDSPKIKAAGNENSDPKIKVKLINKKTGVKITIEKTKGAEAYGIEVYGIGDEYQGYREVGNDFIHSFRKIDTLLKDGSAKRTYTINGLPKGTYYIHVTALKEEKYFEEGEWDTMLSEIGKSEDVKVSIKAAKVKAEEKSYDFSSAMVGDTVWFGSFEQDGLMTNGKEDIEWIVLSKNDKEMLLLSKYVLDVLPYNVVYGDVTWADCTLRDWLNNSFYKTAFTKNERKMIKTTKLKNADNPDHGIDGGKATKDKVFILSADDMSNTKYGFNKSKYSDEIRVGYLTEYARLQGSEKIYHIERFMSPEGKYKEDTWLRTPGMNSNSASNVDLDGSINLYGYVCDFIFGVRPAIVISLK